MDEINFSFKSALISAFFTVSLITIIYIYRLNLIYIWVPGSILEGTGLLAMMIYCSLVVLAVGCLTKSPTTYVVLNNILNIYYAYMIVWLVFDFSGFIIPFIGLTLHGPEVIMHITLEDGTVIRAVFDAYGVMQPALEDGTIIKLIKGADGVVKPALEIDGKFWTVSGDGTLLKPASEYE